MSALIMLLVVAFVFGLAIGNAFGSSNYGHAVSNSLTDTSNPNNIIYNPVAGNLKQQTSMMRAAQMDKNRQDFNDSIDRF